MSSATQLPHAFRAVLETAGQFRAECAAWEEHVEQLQGDLENANAALVEQAHVLRRQRERLADREQQLSEQQMQNERLTLQFEHQEARLAEAVDEVRQLRTLAAATPDKAVENGILSALSAERDELCARLAAAHNEVLQLGQLVQEIAHDRTAKANAESTDAAAAEQADYVAQLEQERSMLEAELDLVRRRAGELAEAVAEHKRELTASRTEAAAELQQVRVLLEQQGKMLSERTGGAVAASAPASEAAPPAAGEGPHDPVIDSVMAQFARLQKDVNQRRLRKK